MAKCYERKQAKANATRAAASAATRAAAAGAAPDTDPPADWPDPDNVMPWQMVSLVLLELRRTERGIMVCVPQPVQPLDKPLKSHQIRYAWLSLRSVRFNVVDQRPPLVRVDLRPAEYRRLRQELGIGARNKAHRPADSECGPADASYPDSLDPGY